ncbi:MAG TPA: DNA starvation/stationary phase protection protein [Bryobacteraceae bacterium]|nr:DNA starvation/stationary phase protection protein [Bryobacteraceae bacterium]
MTTTETDALNLGLTSSQTEDVLALLAAILADTHVLYIKTRNYHWNVTGPDFQQLHSLFETQYTQLEAEIDGVAERIRSLGGQAPGTMAEYLRLASLREEPGRAPAATAMLRAVLADHEALVRSLRDGVDRAAERCHDAGTADFLTGLMEAHEKTAWMLRAHLPA